MVFSKTLVVTIMPMPKLTRVGVLLEIRSDTKNIRVRSNRMTSSVNMTRRCSVVHMMQEGWW